jgi:WD40 repeat protein
MGGAWSPDGTWMVSCGWVKTLKKWDAQTGSELFTLVAHVDVVHKCAISPDGCSIATAVEDKTVKIWDAAIGELCCSLIGHTHGVRVITFSPDVITPAHLRLAGIASQSPRYGQYALK